MDDKWILNMQWQLLEADNQLRYRQEMADAIERRMLPLKPDTLADVMVQIDAQKALFLPRLAGLDDDAT